MFQPVSQAGVTLDGTRGPQMALNGPDYQILAEHGSINGSNLFHSFGQFNIDTGQSATFNGPAGIQNIIGRITGGALSSIDGPIKATIPSANLYLMNPAGFLFGPNASLDVSGSFHVSTSDYISLGNSGIFYADPIKTSVLTVDPPTSFGFVDSNPAGIIIQEATLEVPQGKTLSLIGGNIEITGTNSKKGVLSASGGRIDIASIASPGIITPDDSVALPDFEADSFEILGNINMFQGNIDAGGKGGGTVFIRGGKLTVDSSFIYASTKSASETVQGNGIDIKIAGDMLIDNSAGTGSAIGTNIYNNVNQNSGGVRISADLLEIKNGASIQSVAFPGSVGRSGDIELKTESLLVQNSGIIQAGTGGSKKSGNIIINTDNLEIHDNGVIWTNAFGGSGDSGDIRVTADNVILSNEKYPGYLTGITTQTYWPGTGKGGDITLYTKNMMMLSGTELSTPSFYLGQAGKIEVTIEEKGSVTGKNGVDTGIFANTFWSGNGGDVEINASQFEMNTYASIQASAYSVGNAGNVSFDVDILEIKDGSNISTTGIFGYGGDSGKVNIISKKLILSGFESSTDPFGTDFAGISTVSGYYGGKGGDIDIQTVDLEMTHRSLITANSYGPDKGGLIKIKAENIDVLNGSAITAGAYGSGDSGRVTVDTDRLLVSGVHPELYQDQISNKESIAVSAIASQAGLNGGNSGNLDIKAITLEVLDGGILSTDAFGTGNAGDINITSVHLLVSGENADKKNFVINTGRGSEGASSGITSGTTFVYLGDLATGNGGNIFINTQTLLMKEGGSINSGTSTPGKGGNIDISTQNTALLSGASISAGSRISELAGNAGNIKISTTENFTMNNATLLTSSEQAKGGNIDVEAYRMELSDTTNISAQSSGQGNAGNIYLTGQHSVVIDKSKVTTEALQADGGNIKVTADYMIKLDDSEISASVGGGAETTGGNISIDPQYVLLKNSRITANAFEGQGGNIEIVSNVFLADPDSVIDASSSLGIDGQVDIRSPISQVNGLISPLSKDFRSAVALLRESCMARVHKGEYSSFMIKGRDSLPVEPGRFLSSPLSIQ